MIRLFVAIKINPSGELFEAISVLKEQLSKEKINWVRPENLHLTLLFIGLVSEDEVQFIKSALRKIVNKKTFSFKIEGVGSYGKIKNPKVIFAKIKAGDELQALSVSIRESLKNYFQEPEKIKFSPHLTLGRIKSIKDINRFEALLFDFRNTYFQKADCSGYILYESILTPNGPIYKPLEVFPLK